MHPILHDSHKTPAHAMREQFRRGTGSTGMAANVYIPIASYVIRSPVMTILLSRFQRPTPNAQRPGRRLADW
jgi:hypothetical protein